jgi:hypothetical protein
MHLASTAKCRHAPPDNTPVSTRFQCWQDRSVAHKMARYNDCKVPTIRCERDVEAVEEEAGVAENSGVDSNGDEGGAPTDLRGGELGGVAGWSVLAASTVQCATRDNDQASDKEEGGV